MSEIKHTPGPWGISSESPKIIKQYDSLGETNVIVGSASGYTGSAFFPNDDEAIVNARLIAAAPELLEALILLEAEMVLSGNAGSTDYGWKPAIEKTRAAIAKAIGSQS